MENLNTISPTLNSKLILKNIPNEIQVFNAGLGENPLPTPFYLKKALENNIDKKEYSNIEGNDDFRKSLHSNYPTNMKYTIVGNGLKELIFSLIFNWDKKILIPIPCWVTYLEDLKILKKDYDTILTNQKNNFKLTPNELEEHIIKSNSKGSLLILNNPTNPTGAVYSEEELNDLSLIFEKYDLTVFCDEIYFNCSQDKIKSLSNIYSKCIIGSSLSKDWASGGWRFGWMIFDEQLNNIHKKMVSFGSILYSCPSEFFNYVASVALNNSKNEIHFELQKKFFKKIAQNVENELEKSQIIHTKFQGAWYKWIDFENYKQKLNNININESTSLVEYLAKEIGLIAVPGVHFGLDGLTLRLSLIDENLPLGIKKMVELIN